MNKYDQTGFTYAHDARICVRLFVVLENVIYFHANIAQCTIVFCETQACSVARILLINILFFFFLTDGYGIKTFRYRYQLFSHHVQKVVLGFLHYLCGVLYGFVMLAKQPYVDRARFGKIMYVSKKKKNNRLIIPRDKLINGETGKKIMILYKITR